jgi:hypothetical protein
MLTQTAKQGKGFAANERWRIAQRDHPAQLPENG